MTIKSEVQMKSRLWLLVPIFLHIAVGLLLMTLEPKRHPNGEPEQGPELTLAKWSTRFWAWLIDFVILEEEGFTAMQCT